MARVTEEGARAIWESRSLPASVIRELYLRALDGAAFRNPEQQQQRANTARYPTIISARGVCGERERALGREGGRTVHAVVGKYRDFESS